MNILDWIVMLGTLLGIVAYGVWKTRNVKSVQSYLLGDRDLPWWTIGLSVMATQASAITFLSTPGQAYEDGMRFAQFYIGLPVAMVFLCVFVLPIYYKLKVYTAYEYLEGRFDLKTRILTAILFLIQRGLAAGITIYAPAIVLSSILGWSLNWMILFIGVIVIFYTVMGGTKAVSVTQKQQMIVILTGLFIAAILLVFQLPPDVGFSDAVGVAGKMGKLNVISFKFDWEDRYNFWSGMLGGVFLFLSYFGTDQSQVQRYLSGKSLTESRLGLLFNGILKVPVQFLVLFIGILVFIFFQFEQPPVHFNQANVEKIKNTAFEAEYESYKEEYALVFEEQQKEVRGLINAMRSENEAAISVAQSKVMELQRQNREIRDTVRAIIQRAAPETKTNDTDYIFITFITQYLPIGMVGLLLAVIFSAAMSSTSSELNALATTTVIDLYRTQIAPNRSDQHYLQASKLFTIGWGTLALFFAFWADLFENLIQFVNLIGSLFYGPILGVFLVGFFMKNIKGNAVFVAALLAEVIVLGMFALKHYGYFPVSYLWYNLFGSAAVVIISWLLQTLSKD